MNDSNGEKLNRLISAVAEGYADCLDGIYEIAGARMYAVAAGIVGRDNAEDILHDSFIKIARFAGKYRKADSAMGWLMRIVRNTALDFLKANRQEVDIDGVFNLTSLEYSPEKTENAVMLEEALSKLGKDERRAIYFKYYLDMTVREIAAEMKISKSAADRIIDKGEKKLKTLLADRDKRDT